MGMQGMMQIADLFCTGHLRWPSSWCTVVVANMLWKSKPRLFFTS